MSVTSSLLEQELEKRVQAGRSKFEANKRAIADLKDIKDRVESAVSEYESSGKMGVGLLPSTSDVVMDLQLAAAETGDSRSLLSSYREELAMTFNTRFARTRAQANTLQSALRSMRQFKPVDGKITTQSAAATLDLQLTKVQTLVDNVQASSGESTERLCSIFQSCISALQQMESRAARGEFGRIGAGRQKPPAGVSSGDNQSINSQEALVAELYKLRQQMEASATGADRLSARLTDTAEKLHGSQQMVSELTTSLHLSRKRNGAMENRVADLERMLALRDGLVKKMEDDRKAAKGMITQQVFDAQAADLHNVMDALNAKSEALKAESKAVRILTRDLEIQDRAVQESENQIKDLRRALDRTQTELNSSRIKHMEEIQKLEASHKAALEEAYDKVKGAGLAITSPLNSDTRSEEDMHHILVGDESHAVPKPVALLVEKLKASVESLDEDLSSAKLKQQEAMTATFVDRAQIRMEVEADMRDAFLERVEEVTNHQAHTIEEKLARRYQDDIKRLEQQHQEHVSEVQRQANAMWTKKMDSHVTEESTRVEQATNRLVKAIRAMYQKQYGLLQANAESALNDIREALKDAHDREARSAHQVALQGKLIADLNAELATLRRTTVETQDSVHHSGSPPGSGLSSRVPSFASITPLSSSCRLRKTTKVPACQTTPGHSDDRRPQYAESHKDSDHNSKHDTETQGEEQKEKEKLAVELVSDDCDVHLDKGGGKEQRSKPKCGWMGRVDNIEEGRQCGRRTSR